MKKKLNLRIAAGPVGEPGLEGFEDVAGGVLDAAGSADVGGKVHELGQEGVQVGIVNAGEDALNSLKRYADGGKLPVAHIPCSFHIGVAALKIGLHLYLEDETPLLLPPQEPDFSMGFKLLVLLDIDEDIRIQRINLVLPPGKRIEAGALITPGIETRSLTLSRFSYQYWRESRRISPSRCQCCSHQEVHPGAL